MMGYTARAQFIGTRLRHSCSISSSPLIRHSGPLSSLSNRQKGFTTSVQARLGFSSMPISTTRSQPLAHIKSPSLAPPVLLFSSLHRRLTSRAGTIFDGNSKIRYASTESKPELADGKDEKRYVANLPRCEAVLCFYALCRSCCLLLRANIFFPYLCQKLHSSVMDIVYHPNIPL
jgi:hypothetical protein